MYVLKYSRRMKVKKTNRQKGANITQIDYLTYQLSCYLSPLFRYVSLFVLITETTAEQKKVENNIVLIVPEFALVQTPH